MVSLRRQRKILKRLGIPADKVDACASNEALDKLKQEELNNASNGLNPETDSQG